jgi:hypothetical protein
MQMTTKNHISSNFSLDDLFNAFINASVVFSDSCAEILCTEEFIAASLFYNLLQDAMSMHISSCNCTRRKFLPHTLSTFPYIISVRLGAFAVPRQESTVTFRHGRKHSQVKVVGMGRLGRLWLPLPSMFIAVFLHTAFLSASNAASTATLAAVLCFFCYALEATAKITALMDDMLSSKFLIQNRERRLQRSDQQAPAVTV